jgi:hypothetical protein
MITRYILAVILLALIAPGHGSPSECHARCMRAACKEACSEERVAKDCRPCLESYDSVCTEQCRPKPKPRPRPAPVTVGRGEAR